jgi:hypothetical protein
MFPALFAHHQEALYIQQLVYYVGWLLAGLECNCTVHGQQNIMVWIYELTYFQAGSKMQLTLNAYFITKV